MSKKVNLEEYLIALTKLKLINQEEQKYYEYLKQNKIKHLNQNNILETTISYLTKKNTNYQKIITIRTNIFLKKYSSNQRKYNLFKEKINSITKTLLTTSSLPPKTNLEINILLKQNPNFETLLITFQRLSNNIKNNNYEIKYLTTLIEEKKYNTLIINNFKNNFSKIKTKKRNKNQGRVP